MMTTMLGFLTAVCADATPLMASGSARAVVVKSFLNINASFSFLKFLTNQLTDKFSRRRSGPASDATPVQEEMLDRSVM